MTRPCRHLFLIVVLALCGNLLSAQVPTGTPPFGSFSGGPDIINLANLNVQYRIPVLHKPGRGTALSVDLSYNSSVWSPVTFSGAKGWTPVSNWGFGLVASIGYATHTEVDTYCNGNTHIFLATFSNWTYVDGTGTPHPFNISTWGNTSTPCTTTSATGTSTDGSGYIMKVTGSAVNYVIAPDGTTIYPQASLQDRNGNQISLSGGNYTDTLGVVALSVSGTAPNPVTYAYAAPGATAYYTVTYKPYAVKTNFGCGIAEYGPISNSLVDRVTLPDGSFYQFKYEATPGFSGDYTGRLASVTLPTGGTISYNYTGGSNGIICADGSAATLTRTTPDGTWSYAHSESGTAWTTTITDPLGNQAVAQFQGIYETQRQVYQGSTTGTLLATQNTCYNYSATPCIGTAINPPIVEREIDTVLPNGYIGIHSEQLNNVGMPTLIDEYDYGPSPHGPLLRRTVITYASLGNNIAAAPQTVTICNGSVGAGSCSGGTTFSNTTYTYDEGTPTSLSGTPQHVAITGSRGNPTTIRFYTSASSYLTRTNTYYDTGNVKTATDVNLAPTTYKYPDATSTCGNSFPTGVSEPLNLSRSMTWNCTGGVQTGVTDENGQTTSASYTDSYFWRPATTTDALGNGTAFLYTPSPTNPTFSSAWFMDFNSNNSQASHLQYFDSLGRVYVNQHKQSPNGANLDSVSYTYDANGRLSSTSMPCSIGTAGTCPTPGTTRTYDALGRITGISDAGGGWTSQSYSQNDVLVTVGPAANGAITDPGFEQGLTGWTPCCSGNATLVTNPSYAHSGSSYVQLYATSGNGSQVASNINAAVTPGDKVTFGGWINLQGGSATQMGWWLAVKDSTGTAIAYVGPPLPTTSGWIFQSTSYTVPSGAATVSLYASIYQATSTTTLWVDDAFLNTPQASEDTKRKQLEYNALGQLTSVCEITAGTTAWSGGNCNQGNAQTGYLTVYTYNGIGNLTTVAQNAQGTAQNRTYTYDFLGRLTSELNPETLQVATSYTYDSDSGGQCPGTYNGDLVKRVDPVGNVTCYTHDALHRLTSKTYPFGSYAASTAQKYFVYDIATVNGTAMSNAKTRLAEAYTCASSCSSKTTDLGFSYSARGELTGAWESTQHSGGYYFAQETFWANGAPFQLGTTGITGFPTTFTFGVDGEGRTTTVSATSGRNPVTSASYNLYAAPPNVQVTFGSNDSDVLSYDPNTYRMTQYKFNVGTQSVIGNLNWNPNGSLGSLSITDPFNSANTQTCNYSADDLMRISKADCGPIWGQTFAYDPFGNITKNQTQTGGSSFAPTYQSLPSITNRISQINSHTPTYDANGNSVNDTFREFTWDSDNNTVSIGGSTALTYDALDRMVEQTVGSMNSEIVYGPDGSKLALMNGTTLLKGFVPLTGGATAVYNASGLAFYRHPDHLGSSRLASTPTQTLYSDTAYSPFGETYAQSGALDPSYTGQNQDTTAGLYDFLFREHDPYQSRWTSPDPAGLAAVDPGNPQSWNRYAYVFNDALNSVDPFGLDCRSVNPGGQCGPVNAPNFPAMCLGGACGAGDFGQGGCTLDGTFFPCGWANALLHSLGGAVAQCPNNNCSGVILRGSTLYQYGWIATATLTNGITACAITCSGSISMDTQQGWGVAAIGEVNSQLPDSYANLRQQASDIGTLAAGHSMFWHPVETTVLNLHFVLAGGVGYLAGGAAVVGGCFEPTPAEPLTCGAGVFAGGAAFAGGTVALKGGQLFFTNVTLPSYKEWWDNFGW